MKKVILMSTFALLLAGASAMACDKKDCKKDCSKEHATAACCKKKDAACCKKHADEKPAATPEKK